MTKSSMLHIWASIAKRVCKQRKLTAFAQTLALSKLKEEEQATAFILHVIENGVYREISKAPSYALKGEIGSALENFER